MTAASPPHRYIIRLCSLGFIAIVILPLSLYCGWILYSNWNSAYMKKRRRSITLIMYGFCCYQTLIDSSYWMLSNLRTESAYLDSSAVNHFLWMNGTATRWSFLCFITVRFYLLWFDYEYGKVLSTQRYKIWMDVQFISNNWFCKNRYKYGSTVYMIKRILLPALTAYLVLYFATNILVSYLIWHDLVHSQFSFDVNCLFTSVLMVVAAALIIKCWCKYSSFMDTLYLKHEVTRCVHIVAAMAVCALIATVMNILHLYERDATLISLVAITLLYVPTFYYIIIMPYRKLVKLAHVNGADLNAYYFEQDDDIMMAGQISTADRDGHTNGRASISLTAAANESFNTWQSIVHNLEGYEAFTKYLERELVTETILFVTEYVMLKNAMKETIVARSILEEDLNELDFDLRLPPSLELSAITKQFERHTIFIKAADALFDKYINPETAQLQINISSKKHIGIQKAFMAAKEKDDIAMIKEILPLLENIAHEMSYLMNDSYKRFQKTRIFAELLQHLQNV